MTLQHYFDTVYRPLRLRGRSGNTNRLYGCTIRAFGKWLARAPNLADLADELLLSRYLDHRAEQHSPYTVEKERSQLLAMARLANERRLIPAMPSVQPCVLPDRVPCAWSVEELERLYQSAGRVPGHVGVMPAGEWWTLLIDVAFQSGERIGAILSATVADYRRPTVTFRAEVRKGGRRSRVCHLAEDVCDRLDAMIDRTKAGPGDPLFVWDRCASYLWDRLRGILERAGLSGRRLGFQQVRRSAISHVAHAGADPVQFSGHAQAATTRRWYLDPRYADRGPRACDLLPKIGRG